MFRCLITHNSPSFPRFLDISIKSTMELEDQLTLTTDYGVLGQEEGQALGAEVVDARRMLCGLKKKVLAQES